MAGTVQVFKDNSIERARLMSENEKEQETHAARQKRMDELIAKFKANASGVMSAARQDEIVAATWDFDGPADLGTYMKRLTADRN